MGLGYRREEAESITPHDMKHLPLLDWNDLLRISTGMMGYSAEQFWRMTMLEFTRAYEGFCLLHHISAPDVSIPASREELELLIKRFPDKI